MIEAQPVFASLTADMIQRPRLAILPVLEVEPARWWRSRDLREFVTAFVGGFLFFYALIA